LTGCRPNGRVASVSFERNKQFLKDLFAGSFRGHGIVVSPPWPPNPAGDFLCSESPAQDWGPWIEARYEAMAAHAMAVDDDSVPYVGLNTNTGIFAAAFGCRLHVYEGMDTNASALPAVETAEEADGLPDPDPLSAPSLARFFEIAALARSRLGPDAPIGVPDIQSPFDIAALVWKKENLLLALYERPDAVKRLVEKCHRLLSGFLRTFIKEFGNVNLCHCPTAWAPPELGVWLSEDEAGSVSTEMFEEFCLPSLVALSREFGGLFMHCCAAADHQYGSFLKIPHLRGLNRVFQSPGPMPAIRAFSGKTVLIQAWLDEKEIGRFLDMALPNTRYLFNPGPLPVEEAKRLVERFKNAVGRS